METTTLGGGCFWCTEGIFQQIKGVKSVVSGYSGGEIKSPSYEQVSDGSTNHAEAVQIEFDPKIINYKDILNIFFKTHDPTTMNRQGNDLGTQYRSVIFFHDENQKKVAEELRISLQKDYNSPIVTQIIPYENFYKAEDYHQNYFENNKDKPYCQIVIDPKIQKLKKKFKDFVK